MTTTAPAPTAASPRTRSYAAPRTAPPRTAPTTVREPARPSFELDGPVAPLRAIVRAVTQRVHERPLTAVAAAVALGVIVGGGLSFRLGRLLLASASRHVVREVLKQVL
jgi:hypothetical protein